MTEIMVDKHPAIQYIEDFSKKCNKFLEALDQHFPLAKYLQFYSIIYDLLTSEELPQKKCSLFFYRNKECGFLVDNYISNSFEQNLGLEINSIVDVSLREYTEIHSCIWTILFYTSPLLSGTILMTIGDKLDPLVLGAKLFRLFDVEEINKSNCPTKYNFKSAWNKEEQLKIAIKRCESLWNNEELFLLEPSFLTMEQADYEIEYFGRHMFSMVGQVAKDIAKRDGVKFEEMPDLLAQPLYQHGKLNNLGQIYKVQRDIFKMAWLKVFKPKFEQLSMEIDSSVDNKSLANIKILDLTSSKYLVS